MRLINKKKQLGFTITELLAVIVILGILIGIAIPVYNKIRKNVLDTQYKSVASLIETKAKEYASSTGLQKTTVESLINNGYLKADDESGLLHDPRDNSILNCRVVNMTDDGTGEYTAEITSDNSTNNEGKCNNNIQDNSDALLCNGVKCTNNWYQNGTNGITLSIDKNAIEALKNIDLTDKITWSSTIGVSSDNTKSEYKIISNGISTNATYTATIKANDKLYTVSHIVKVDGEVPVLNDSLSKIENENNWAQSKKYTAVATDNNGSGIAGYLELTNGECPTDGYKADNTFTFTTNGIHNICIKDNVGNITKTQTREIKMIDSTAPTKKTNASLYQTGHSTDINQYNDNESGISEIRYCLTTTTDNILNSNSCFTNGNASYSLSCGQNYYLYTYAIDKAGNASVAELSASYYQACYTPPTYSDNTSSDNSSYRERNYDNSTTCDDFCQMEKNAEACVVSKSTCDAGNAANIEIAKRHDGLHLDADGHWRDKDNNKVTDPPQVDKTKPTSSGKYGTGVVKDGDYIRTDKKPSTTTSTTKPSTTKPSSSTSKSGGLTSKTSTSGGNKNSGGSSKSGGGSHNTGKNTGGSSKSGGSSRSGGGSKKGHK